MQIDASIEAHHSILWGLTSPAQKAPHGFKSWSWKVCSDVAFMSWGKGGGGLRSLAARCFSFWLLGNLLMNCAACLAHLALDYLV